MNPNLEVLSPGDLARPVREQDRLVALDVLRGAAVLGILLVNVFYFGFPMGQSQYLAALEQRPPADQWIRHAVDVLVEGKFITLFSLLFGMGLALQFSKLNADQPWFAKLYRRRLWLLMLIGLLHGTLLWYGDILLCYSVIGFIALAFRRMAPRKQRRWAVALFIVAIGLCSLFEGCSGLKGQPPGADTPLATTRTATTVTTTKPAETTRASTEPTATSAPASATFPATGPAESGPEFRSNADWWNWFSDQETCAYQSGSLRRIFATRALSFAGVFVFSLVLFGPWVLAAFVLGQSFIKSKLFAGGSENRNVFSGVWVIGLAVGLPLAALGRFLLVGVVQTFWLAAAGQAMTSVGALALSLGYLGAIASLCSQGARHPVLRSLAAVGRMALTSYITHSVICTTIFYSYGLAWFDRISYLQAIIMVLVIFGLQLLISPVWLRHFHFGPLEWLWRSLTYRKWQPMRRQAA